MALLTALTPDERTTFLVVALAAKALKKLVARLGTAPPGTRLESLSVWDLAWSLVDYYPDDAEVADQVDRVLAKELSASPLAAAVAADGGAAAVTDLVLTSRDPARDLAWAVLAWGGERAGELASSLIQTIIAEYDQADEAARQDESAEGEAAEQPGPEGDPADDERAAADRLLREHEKERLRAQRARERALKRVGSMKDRLVELESGLAAARREARVAEEARARLESEHGRLADERDMLRSQLRTGSAGEVVRLGEELETARRRQRALEAELEEMREAETTLRARVRALETERPARPAASTDEDETERTHGTATWSLPIFTDEFYESIRRWDRKVVRNAFEKIARLADDWRHPSLRAIPLEGLPGCYRIRIATDVRLIYRPLDGHRLEILSLIDREDLQRYIRQAKTR